MFSLTSTGIHADQFQTTAGLEFFWIGILFVFFYYSFSNGDYNM